MKRWNYRIRYLDENGRSQEHFTDAKRLETAIAETQTLPGYVRLYAWVSYQHGESGFFDPIGDIPSMERSAG